MSWEIAQLLATYLDATPGQVMAWDKDVVENLIENQRTFRTFKHGCAQTRWGIYHALKYPDSVWAARG